MTKDKTPPPKLPVANDTSDPEPADRGKLLEVLKKPTPKRIAALVDRLRRFENR
ncbi:MAG: hypothetical protein ABJH52_10970 [Henriciella sp.]